MDFRKRYTEWHTYNNKLLIARKQLVKSQSNPIDWSFIELHQAFDKTRMQRNHNVTLSIRRILVNNLTCRVTCQTVLF